MEASNVIIKAEKWLPSDPQMGRPVDRSSLFELLRRAFAELVAPADQVPPVSELFGLREDPSDKRKRSVVYEVRSTTIRKPLDSLLALQPHQVIMAYEYDIHEAREDLTREQPDVPWSLVGVRIEERVHVFREVKASTSFPDMMEAAKALKFEWSADRSKRVVMPPPEERQVQAVDLMIHLVFAVLVDDPALPLKDPAQRDGRANPDNPFRVYLDKDRDERFLPRSLREERTIARSVMEEIEAKRGLASAEVESRIGVLPYADLKAMVDKVGSEAVARMVGVPQRTLLEFMEAKAKAQPKAKAKEATSGA